MRRTTFTITVLMIFAAVLAGAGTARAVERTNAWTLEVQVSFSGPGGTVSGGSVVGFRAANDWTVPVSGRAPLTLSGEVAPGVQAQVSGEFVLRGSVMNGTLGFVPRGEGVAVTTAPTGTVSLPLFDGAPLITMPLRSGTVVTHTWSGGGGSMSATYRLTGTETYRLTYDVWERPELVSPAGITLPRNHAARAVSHWRMTVTYDLAPDDTASGTGDLRFLGAVMMSRPTGRYRLKVLPGPRFRTTRVSVRGWVHRPGSGGLNIADTRGTNRHLLAYRLLRGRRTLVGRVLTQSPVPSRELSSVPYGPVRRECWQDPAPPDGSFVLGCGPRLTGDVWLLLPDARHVVMVQTRVA